MSSAGTEYTGKLLKGDYSVLWISTPSDWYVRTPTKKSANHWQRISNWINKGTLLGLSLCIFGPPGFFWKIPNIKEMIQNLDLNVAKMRLCHFGDKFNQKDNAPSGSYLQIATNKTFNSRLWQCNCAIQIDKHLLDWYGHSAEQAEWRKTISAKYIRHLCATLQLKVDTSISSISHVIRDDVTPPSPIPTDFENNVALPTEARVRQKERLKKLKELGLKPKKKFTIIEPGDDDCGDDISGLGKDITLLSADYVIEELSSSDEDTPLFYLIPRTPSETHTNTLSAIAYLCYGKNNEVDILELCGGEGRISKVAFRRNLTSGGNLDLVTGYDLGDPQVQKALRHYLKTCHVLVTILQPNCRSVGSFSHYNKIHYYDTWSKHHQEDLPHIKFCGEVAWIQMKLNRFWLREQPGGSWIDDIEPWTYVTDDDNVVKQYMDQCMAGAVDDDGLPVRKITSWTTNSEALIIPMRKFSCDGSHIHGTPTGKALEKMKLYPWKLCLAVVNGVELLKKWIASGLQISYPTVATDTPSSSSTTIRRPPPLGLGCPACAIKIRNDSVQHTRDPRYCRHYDVATVKWDCPSCQDDKGRNSRKTDPGHSLEHDKCRFAPPPQRTGAHPREPRAVATDHPSAEASALDAASSSQDPAPADRAVRGPDTVQRVRRTFEDSGTGPARPPDWSRFNVQVSLRNLRSYDAPVIQKELRKLHLRWWHAKEPKMRAILQAAGIDTIRLDMIKAIVDTCRECRAWQKRGNVVMPSLSLPTKFNEQGECDLFFYKTYIAFHIIDRAIRLSDGKEVPSRHSQHLLDAYATSWVQRNGPFGILYSDGELGLNNEASIAELKRLGTTLRIRAPDQHARIAEVRQAMLRHVMHMIEEDLKRHNLTLTFQRLYAEALFVVNAFTFYNGVSPYNALTGRQPACLPDFENPDFPAEGTPSDDSRERRIRETAIEAITQSCAVAKVNRALKTSTTPDGSKLYKTGDLIDYHRPTHRKDETGGWHGPYPVVRNEPDRGQLVCAHGGQMINVRYPDARLTLFIEILMTLQTGMDHNAMDTVLQYIDRLSAGKTPEIYGYVPSTTDKNTFQLSAASRNAPKVYLALQFVIRTFFRISDVIAVKIGKSVTSVNSCEYASSCVLIYYTNNLDPDFHFHETKDTALNIQHIAQSNKARIIQCLVKPGCPYNIDDTTDLNQELMPNPRGSANDNTGDVPEAVRTPQDPPTPIVVGDLPTIDEDDEERDDDSLMIECFYTELMDSLLLADDSRFPEMPKEQVYMMPEETVLFMVPTSNEDDEPITHDRSHGDVHLEELEVSLANADCKDLTIEEDEIGEYVELCFTPDMSKLILSEDQFDNVSTNEQVTLRVYIAEDIKRTVVIKEDDLLTKQEMFKHAKEVADATYAEIKKWLGHSCFKKRLLKDAQNVMTSRYVSKWKWVKDKVNGTMSRIIRMRLCLRGFMDLEAFSLDTFSGTAKRQSQRILASEAACHEDYIIASLDIDTAFLQGFTYKELAEATGEKERVVCFKLPPGSASILRKFPGFEDFDETIHCLQCIKPGTGTKDAPRAFSLKLRKVTSRVGLKSTSYDTEFEIQPGLLTAKHVDDISMTGTEGKIDSYTKAVEDVFGKCKLNKKQYTNCGVRYTQLENGDIVMDQDEYIATMRPIQTPELTGAPAEQDATKTVSDLFVSLRGALAYTTLTQAWIQVYIVSLQRVQQPKNLDVRRLNAITRKLQQKPQKLVYPAMKCSGKFDIHTDSGYRRMTEVDDEKGYGMRGTNLLRRGERRHGKGDAVHLIDSICKSHKLTIRSSYGAEMLAAAHGVDDVYPTLVTLEELKYGVLTPTQLKSYREEGGLRISVVLTTDAESVYKSLTSRDLKVPTERTLLGHVSWIRELLQLHLIESVQWCDTRDMTADGHTKGSIERDLLLEVMSGKQSYRHDVKKYAPYRAPKQPL